MFRNRILLNFFGVVTGKSSIHHLWENCHQKWNKTQLLKEVKDIFNSVVDVFLK